MGEMKQETPTMSPFCEAIMERTEDVNQLKTTRDCAIVMCSDGDTLACRIAGSYDQIFNMLVKKMMEDKVFCRAVSFAVHAYIAHTSEYLSGPEDKNAESDIAKEVTFN